MKKWGWILLVVLSANCTKKQEREIALPRLKPLTAQKGILINSEEMLQSRSPLFAINFKSDASVLKHPNQIADESNSVGFNDTLPDLKAFKVYVDTKHPLNATGFLYKNFKTPDMRHFNRSQPEVADRYYAQLEAMEKTVVSCNPVFVYNASNQPQQMYRPNLNTGFYMIQEALDSDGKWKPIEFMFDFVMCGNGHYDFKIQPKQYVASGILIYDGDFDTKLRVKLRAGESVYYSNEFDGRINRSQFNQDFLTQFLKDNDRYYEGDASIRKDIIDVMFLNYPFK